MKPVKSVLVNLLTLAFSCHFFATSQTQKLSSAIVDGRSYAIVNLQTNFPEFSPLKRKALSDIRSASIPLADSLGTLFICFGRDAYSNSHYYLLQRRNDGTTEISKFDITQVAPDTLGATLDVRLWQDRQTPFPLDLRIVPSKHQLLFRWILSPPNDPTPGGEPAPADLLVDVGKSFPDLSLRDLDGKAFSTNSLRGKPAIISWWDTGCSAFIDELPGLDSLVSIFGQEVSFLAITQDSAQEVVSFLNNHRFRFSQTVGNDTTVQALGHQFPRTLVLDTDGVVHLDLMGGGSRETYKQVEKAVKKVLRE